jgi:hypothetical protein
LIVSEQTNMDYYRSRALRERELVRTSASGSVALIHLEMAEHYEKILSRNAERNNPVEIRTTERRFGGR